MKKQKKSFADLANYLDCSLVTAKRSLNKEEISLSRLNEILAWLNLSYGDLQMLIEQEQIQRRFTLTERQEDYFYKKPKHYAAFIELYGDSNSEALAKKFEFSKKELASFLSSMDKLELIEWGPNDQIKLTNPDFPKLIPKGKLQKKYFEKVVDYSTQLFRKKLAERIYSSVEIDEPRSYSLIGVDIHPDSYDAYTKKLNEVFEELHILARKDKLTFPEAELKNYLFLLGFTSLDARSEHENMITEVLGK